MELNIFVSKQDLINGPRTTAHSAINHALFMINIPADQTIWRGLDWGGILVEVEYQTHRIICPEHGVSVAEVPWAYPGSRFTKDFDLTVAWFASYLPRSTTSYFMRVDWETVGRCVNRTLHDLEPADSEATIQYLGCYWRWCQMDHRLCK